MILVLYAYYEEDRTDYVHDNYNFFMKYGYYNDDNIYYIFIVNGRCTIELKKAHNIKIIYRENYGYDFGAFRAGLKSISLTDYDYYFFINSSTRGPFLMPFCSCKWYYPFLKLMSNDVKLVGPSINPMESGPHVQTYAFLIDREALMYVFDNIFDKEYNSFYEVVINQEIGLSSLILSKGWNISSLIPEQQDIDYRNFHNDSKYKKINHKNDTIYSGKLNNGRDLHPYELIFIKVNRNLNQDEIKSLTNYYLSSFISC